MATFTIGLSGSAVVNGSKNWTLSDGDVQSLVNFLVVKYSGSAVPALTAQQCLALWAQDFVNRTIADVKGVPAGNGGVPPIVFT
jgi:hypothetical protein